MGITANAAIRTGMITLEMELASRILAVSTTFGASNEVQQSFRDRLAYLRRTLEEILLAASVVGENRRG